MCVWPNTRRACVVPSTSSTSSSAGSGANERTSETGEACTIRAPATSASNGSAPSSPATASPSAPRQSAIAPWIAVVVRRLGRVADPAVDVAAHPHGGLELAQPRDGLHGPGAEQRVIAAEHPLVGSGGTRVGEHRVERGEVAVDVVEDGDHRRRV